MRCSWNGYYLEYCGFVKQVTSHFRRHLKKYDRMWFLLRIYLSSVGRGIYGNPWEKSRVEVCVTVDSISFNPRKSIRTKDSLNKRDNKKIRINKVVKRPQPTLFYGTRIEFSKNKKKKKNLFLKKYCKMAVQPSQESRMVGEFPRVSPSRRWFPPMKQSGWLSCDRRLNR